MLLIIEALLISAALGQLKPIYLDMAPDSVDDLYVGCRDKMADLVRTKYLQKELKKSNKFNKAWVDGEKKLWEKGTNESIAQDDNMTMNHLIAIGVYTSNHVYQDFNGAVRNGRQNYIDKTFMWHSLHFLLTDAIQILNKKQNACRFTTFRGTKIKFNQNVLNTGVRFGSFASSSLYKHIAKPFGDKSCFEIYTCEGAEVTKYSRFPYEKEVLIPPYETFVVSNVSTKADQQDLWCETVYTLVSNGTLSNLNCALQDEPTGILRNVRQHLKNFICGLFSQMTMCKCCG